MRGGRFDEAMSKMKRSKDLDPHNRLINRAIGRVFYFSRQYDKALDYFQSLLVMEPNDPRFHWSIGEVYEVRGMYPQAVENHLESLSLSGDSKPEEIERLKEIFKLSGWQGYLQAMRARMEEQAKKETVIPSNMAQLYARLGDKEMAFAWLEKAVHERDPQVIRLKIEPMFDSLRSDPRYTKLLQRMNLAT